MDIALLGARILILLDPARRARDRADAGGERREDRVDRVDRFLRPADHHAIAALEPPDAAGGADIDVMRALLGQRLGAADVVLVEAVATIDDDVALGVEAADRRDCLLGRVAGGEHHPIDAGCVELVAHVLERARADRAVGDEPFDRWGVAVEHHGFVACAHQSPRDIAAHAAKADDPDLHG